MSSPVPNQKQPRSLQILREYQTYSFKDACKHTVEHRLMVFVPKELNFYFLPLQGYLPDLQVTLQDGKISPIVSHKDFHKIVQRPGNRPFTLDEIRKEAAQVYGVSEELMQKYKSFAIVLFPDHDDHFNEIIVKWTSPHETPKKTSALFTNYSEFKVNTLASDDASLYITFNVNEKYEIQNNPPISKFVDGKIGIEKKKTVRNKEPVDSSNHVMISNKKQQK